jgi:hypothetical protein
MRFLILVLGGHRDVALENAALRQQFGLQKKRETAETASMRRAFLDFIDEGLDSVSTPEYPL